MLTFSKGRKGLAIITTLMIITLLMALVGAFLIVNRAGNRFTLNSIERRTAEEACQSAFAFVRFQLEKDREWGTEAKPVSGTLNFPGVGPTVRMTLSQVVGPDNIDGEPTSEVTGTGAYSPSGDFSSPRATFTLKVRNNLNKRAPAPGIVPKRAVKVEIVSNVSGSIRSLDALLRPKPIAHESASAGSNLDLGGVGGLVRIASDDPYSNQLRAGQDLRLPDVDDVRFVKHGVASSENGLYLGSQNLASASATAVRNAGETAGGVFNPSAVLSNFSEFDPAEFSLPTNSDNLPAGVWTFGEVTHHEYKEHEVEYVTYTAGIPTGKDKKKRYRRRASIYNSLRAPDGQVWAASTAIPGKTGPWMPPPSGTMLSEGAAASYGYGADTTGFVGVAAQPPTKEMHDISPGLRANVTTAQFVVRSGWQLKFNGDFIVTGEGDRSPELYFGYDMDTDGVAHQESLNDGLEAAQDNPGQYMGALVANGNLNVTGGVLGYGSMIAGGELTIKASSGLRTAPGLGVVVKGNDVIVNPATEPEPSLPGEPLNVDYPVFREAVNSESGGDWTAYDAWLEHEAPVRDTIVQNLGNESVGASASALWSTFNTEIGGGGPYPAAELSSNSWPSGNITVEQYVRLKTFYQTKASLYNNGDGQLEWLDFGQKQDGAKNRIENILNDVAQNAESHKLSFQDFLTSPPSDVPDMYIEGIVFADNDITINAGGGSIKLEGAVVAKDGNVTLNDASKADLVYSRNLLDDLATGGVSKQVPLEAVFFTLN